MGQIGTLKVETASGPVELPVFALGDSNSDTLEALRVQTASGPGFVPLDDPADADRPYLRVQTGSGVKAVSTSPGLVAQSDLLAHYELDDSSTPSTAIDSSGNGNDGVINNAAYAGSGKVGTNSLSFNGFNSEVDLPRLGISGSDSFTIAAWVKFADLSSGMTTYHQGDRSSNSQIHIVYQPDVDNWLFAFFDNDLKYNINHSTGVWIHVAGTYDGFNQRLYIDGTQEASRTPGSVSIVNDDYAIGYIRETGRVYHDGLIDDVRIYNRELSSTEVSDIYNNTE